MHLLRMHICVVFYACTFLECICTYLACKAHSFMIVSAIFMSPFNHNLLKDLACRDFTLAISFGGAVGFLVAYSEWGTLSLLCILRYVTLVPSIVLLLTLSSRQWTLIRSCCREAYRLTYTWSFCRAALRRY